MPQERRAGVNRLMNSLLQHRVRHILLHDWDPIGIKDAGGPDDEYDAYIGPLVSKISHAPMVDDIIRYLNLVERDTMGLLPNPERAHHIARKLIALAQ